MLAPPLATIPRGLPRVRGPVLPTARACARLLVASLFRLSLHIARLPRTQSGGQKQSQVQTANRPIGRRFKSVVAQSGIHLRHGLLDRPAWRARKVQGVTTPACERRTRPTWVAGGRLTFPIFPEHGGGGHTNAPTTATRPYLTSVSYSTAIPKPLRRVRARSATLSTLHMCESATANGKTPAQCAASAKA